MEPANSKIHQAADTDTPLYRWGEILYVGWCFVGASSSPFSGCISSILCLLVMNQAIVEALLFCFKRYSCWDSWGGVIGLASGLTLTLTQKSSVKKRAYLPVTDTNCQGPSLTNCFFPSAEAAKDSVCFFFFFWWCCVGVTFFFGGKFWAWPCFCSPLQLQMWLFFWPSAIRRHWVNTSEKSAAANKTQTEKQTRKARPNNAATWFRTLPLFQQLSKQTTSYNYRLFHLKFNSETNTTEPALVHFQRGSPNWSLPPEMCHTFRGTAAIGSNIMMPLGMVNQFEHFVPRGDPTTVNLRLESCQLQVPPDITVIQQV